MIVMCHKPAQIINTSRMRCDDIFLSNYNEADLLKKNNKYVNVNIISMKKLKT